MIEINLLPDEIKTRAVRQTKISLDPRYFIDMIPFVFAAIILVHVCLAAVVLTGNIQLGMLSGKWAKLNPQRELVGSLNKKFNVLISSNNLIQELGSRRLNWSEKLGSLSLDLPSGVWFNEMLISHKELALKASVVSLQKQEMSLIKKFIDTLKADTVFSKNFNSIELGSLQKRAIGSYGVIDFTLTARSKTK